jgi:predicted ATPase
MITSLQIKNFKGWKDTGPLRIAPITVFFGTNSSGKSSLGQFLMMLKQTASSPDRNRVLHPGDNKTPVDLGTFEDLLSQHDEKRELEFTLEWQPVVPLEITDVLTDEVYIGKQIRFEAVIRFENGKGVRAVMRKFEYRFSGKQDSRFSAGMVQDELQKGKYQLSTDGFQGVRKTGRAWPLPSPSRFFGFPDELNSYYQNADTLNDLALAMQNILQGIAYLGPLREEPRRRYEWAGEAPEDVGTRGDRWASAFLAAGERKLRAPDKQRSLTFEHTIAFWLEKLGLIHSFCVVPVAKGVREYRVRVKVNETSPEVSIPDVGFGVSQVLPVIVESFYAPPNTTIIIEQPELHLHPAVQLGLADLFIAATHCSEGGKKRNVQFLIESHSEHFLRRLQRRIAEEKIKKEEVAIYFCDFGTEGGKIEPLDVDMFGNIRNWPRNFFGDQMTDIAEMQKAGIRRRKEAKADEPKPEVGK